MKLDDLARRAAHDVRERARSTVLDFDAFRRRRTRRVVLAGVAGVVTIAVAVIGASWLGQRETVTDTTQVPITTSTTPPTSTTTGQGTTTTTEPVTATSTPTSTTEASATRLVVTPQAGPTGTQLTLTATAFPVGWSEWWLVNESGDPVVEIPSGFYPHDNPDFTFTLGVDSTNRRGITTIDLPPGTYRFAIDGEVIANATFTKTEQRYPPLEVGFERVGTATIGTLTITNTGGGGPLYLDGWSIVDEIPTRTSMLIGKPTSSAIAADELIVVDDGATYTVRFQQDPNCQPGERLATDEISTSYCTGPTDESSGDSLALYTAGGELVDRIVIAPTCAAAPDEPDCGYATFTDPETSIAYRVPDDTGLDEGFGRWRIADETLTPDLADPMEVLSLGTYPLRPGGDDCAQIPENALEDLGPLDAFISLQRRIAPAALGSSGRQRPDEFTYEWLDQDAALGFWDCLDRPDTDTLYLRFVPFRVGTGQYYLIVALGSETSSTVRYQQVLDILNSLDLTES